PARRVLPVDDAEVDLELLAERGQALLHSAPSRGSEHVAEEEDVHAASARRSRSSSVTSASESTTRSASSSASPAVTTLGTATVKIPAAFAARTPWSESSNAIASS